MRYSNELYHYGMPRRSGRYPWGSGDRPYQHGGTTYGKVANTTTGMSGTLEFAIDEKFFKSSRIRKAGVPEKIENLKRKTENMTIDEDLKSCNPGIKKINNREYTSNCTNCSVTMEMRRRGYDVEARPTEFGYINSPRDGIIRCFDNAEFFSYNFVPGKERISYKEGFERVKNSITYVSNKEPNSSGALMIKFNSSYGGGGHCLWFDRKDGETKIYDPQYGNECTDKDFKYVDFSFVNMIRLDNATPNNNVTSLIHSKDYKSTYNETKDYIKNNKGTYGYNLIHKEGQERGDNLDYMGVRYTTDYLAHYGTKTSGRYPRGSGKRPYQHGGKNIVSTGKRKKTPEEKAERKKQRRERIVESLIGTETYNQIKSGQGLTKEDKEALLIIGLTAISGGIDLLGKPKKGKIRSQNDSSKESDSTDYGKRNDTPKTSITQRIKSSLKSKAERKKELKRIEKEVKRMTPDEREKAYQEAKQRAINSGTASDVLKFQGDLTNQELEIAKKRLTFESDLRAMSAKEKATYIRQLESITSKVKATTDAANVGISAYNTLASIYNATEEGREHPWTLVNNRR